MNVPHPKNFADLIKDLKYEHQSIFPCGGGSNLILGTGTENQQNSSCYQVFPPNCQKMTLWCKKKIITHPDGFV